MNIAHIETQSFIYGPGCRFVIWVQGCSIHCKGCWNKSMWSFKPKITASVAELIQMILSYQTLIEGVTFLGGEPFDQYPELLDLTRQLQSVGLSVMIFTGYDKDEIESKGQNEVFNYADILITGRYEEDKRTVNHQWIGSTNQKILFLSPKYQLYQIKDANYIEVTLEESGKLLLLGFPDSLYNV